LAQFGFQQGQVNNAAFGAGTGTGGYTGQGVMTAGNAFKASNQTLSDQIAAANQWETAVADAQNRKNGGGSGGGSNSGGFSSGVQSGDGSGGGDGTGGF
jgi:hypothetical protein